MEFDPRLTFETFVIGPANRLAAAAAKRVAESPGVSYNPLFLYSASGLGKSHILAAIAQHSGRQAPTRRVVYQTLEGYLEELALSLQKGGADLTRDRYSEVDILLLDDVQFLTGQPQAQEMLLRTLDTLTARGGQVVLASDRPPSEINGLDARLLSRFSGGLIVDMAPPDYETRVAIMRRKAEERGMTFSEGVAERMARHPFRNVRELQGALNRLFAIQELEERPVTLADLPELLGQHAGAVGAEGAGPEALVGISEGSGVIHADLEPMVVEEPRWRTEVMGVARWASADGFGADRILRLLEEEGEPPGWPEALSTFRSEIERVRAIRAEIQALGNPWPEAAATLLADADRLEEAENLLASARERARPFRELPEGPTLDELTGVVPSLALRAAGLLVRSERPDYNPLYLYSSDPALARGLLEAAGRSYLELHPERRAGLTSVSEFSQEFIRAITEGVAGAWRERWWGVDLLLLHGVEGLSITERAQEEFFHLFEALKRRGGRILLAADRPPAGIAGIDERLRSRFEGGLVVAVTTPVLSAPAPQIEPPQFLPEPPQFLPEPPQFAEELAERAVPTSPPVSSPPVSDRTAGLDDLSALRELAGVARGRSRGEQEEGAGGERETVVVAAVPPSIGGDRWYPPAEKVVWNWPYLEEVLTEFELPPQGPSPEEVHRGD